MKQEKIEFTLGELIKVIASLLEHRVELICVCGLTLPPTDKDTLEKHIKHLLK